MNKISLNLLGSHITNCNESNYILLDQGANIDFRYNKHNNLFFLVNGNASLIRKSDGITIIDYAEPALLGVMNLFSTEDLFYIHCDSSCEFYTLESKKAVELFNTKGLWEHVARIYTTYTEKLLRRDTIISSMSTYSIVKSNLEIIWNMPDDLRSRTSIYGYILDRNKISRSALHKILKELNYGGYIHSVRGRLMSLKHLPDSF